MNPRRTRWLSAILIAPLLIALAGCQHASSDRAAQPVPSLQTVVKPADSYFARFEPKPYPKPADCLLQPGDRLAICGDSITEQKMYSRIMETYLTVCVPDLAVTVRQYGWSGETAPGFLARMTNDCLRFKPTIATTCYGMNDHGYRPYDDTIGRRYRDASIAILKAFQAAGARVIQGSPGCVGKRPQWSQSAQATTEDLNLNLCTLRNIGIEIALEQRAGFADVFWPMLVAGFEAQKRHGPDFAVPGKDGVHPDWAGQVVMAYAFLRAMGLDGEIGRIDVDLSARRAKASTGHQVLGFDGRQLNLRSSRYPFCPGPGDITRDNQQAAGMALVPFHDQLNRLTLVAKGGKAPNYRITWGTESRVFSKAELAKGINLAAAFPLNPFLPAFKKVDEAVAAKQAYETRQIKQLFHGAAGKADMDGTVAKTEAERAPLAAAIKSAFVPVEHAILVAPE